METWTLVMYVYLLNGSMYVQRIRHPIFDGEAVCEMFKEQPSTRKQILDKYFVGDGVAYVLPKCEKEVEV